ncbi:MAG: DUF262 domain-containing protein, partial [Meiothermus sp.]|uniref:DUF262 domain-containing protein n=1 Tax=Meiothermus sp. TaxID=1955249 RepID=UPI0025F6F1DD
MSMVSTPASRALVDVIKHIHTGELVLPEFQRSFVWKPSEVSELFASIFEGYFIGTLLLLDKVDPAKPPFSLRLFEGVKCVNPTASLSTDGTVMVVLDGQQRLTALYQALHVTHTSKGAMLPSGISPICKTESPYEYFLHLDELDGKNYEDAVQGIHYSRKSELSAILSKVSRKEAVRMVDLF